MNLIVSLGIFLPLCFSSVYTLQCRSYGRQVGECVDISRCPPFLAIILSEEKTKEDLQMLQKLTCLSASDPDKEPVVCCPLTEIVSKNYIPNPQAHFGNSATTRSPPTVSTARTFTRATKEPTSTETPRLTVYPSNPGQGHRVVPVPDKTKIEEAQVLYQKFQTLIPSLDSCSRNDGAGDRIVGGNDTLHGMYPWMARLGYKSLKTGRVEYYCGGVIINSRYILTAGHCTHGYDDSFALVHVRLGEHNTKQLQDCNENLQKCSTPEDIQVEKVITYPGYNTVNKHNDIALVRLARDINFNTLFIKPMCLPFYKEYGVSEPNLLELKAVVAGWGRTNWTRNEGSAVLQQVRLPIVPTQKCIADFRNRINITPKQLCAGGEAGKDSCGGDSGGPLMMDVEIGKNGIFPIKRSFQIGIVSFGPVKCGIGIPGVYTRVSEYLPWILKSLEP
ncbi:Serine protease easter [Orchesella cincta]|uniref:CLIP domain-containing serine protease n=1 Tax=Orchesella cincta TaxID=48709 RepID=A0A1D2MDI9_ORCCI|nr:Serine protease easter [Orchesella cincta]